MERLPETVGRMAALGHEICGHPDAEDVALAGDGDADSDLEGSVDELLVADLDHDGVDEHDRVDGTQALLRTLIYEKLRSGGPVAVDEDGRSMIESRR